MTAPPGYRPGPLAWLGYAMGGRLRRHVEWVRHDLTDHGWRTRALLRLLVQLAPFVALIAFLPGLSVTDEVLLELLVVLSAVFTSVATAEQLRDRRLRQHGLSPPSEPPGPAGLRSSGGERPR